MPRAGLNTVSVYAKDDEKAVLEKAALMEGRSLSNYLIWHGMRVAEEHHGLKKHGVTTAKGTSRKKKK